MAITEQTQTLLTTIAENMPKVKRQGYDEGRKAEYDAFWDIMQENGDRTDYNAAFGSRGFTKENFKPKYNINVGAGERMFYQFNYSGEAFDLVEHLDNLGITIDFSNNMRFYYCFYGVHITRLGIIDFSNATIHNNSNAFAYSYIATIDKLIFNENTVLTNLFVYATALTNIKEVEGIIGTSISFSSSPLTVESMKSIISCLKDYSGTESEHTYTITFTSACKTSLEAEGATAEYTQEDGTTINCTWLELIGYKKWLC